MKQRLLELSDTEQRLTVELGFLRRLLPQLRSLLERKRETPQGERKAAAGRDLARRPREVLRQALQPELAFGPENRRGGDSNPGSLVEDLHSAFGG